MKKTRFNFMVAALSTILSVPGAIAQTSSSCPDLNGYVDSKNTGGTSSFTLQSGTQRGAQTYQYNGLGRITSVRVYGNFPHFGAVPLRVVVYNVDVNGRPTTQLTSSNATFSVFDNIPGFIDVDMPGAGIYVSNNFAISVELRNPSWPALGQDFNLAYTGDGEGGGEDLASVAGSSTGYNWTSAMTNYSHDGDFYIVPDIRNYIDNSFSVSSSCIPTGSTVSFSNHVMMVTGKMFNQIGDPGYAGSYDFYSWDFGDGSPVSHATNPTHTYNTAGVYTVTLTATVDDWNGSVCQNSYSKQISVGLAVTASANNAACYGASDGSITATATGGAASYMYSVDGMNWQSNGTFNNLAAGFYTVYVKDALGCTDVTSATVTQNPQITATISTTNSSCGNADGGILVTGAGGTGALTYAVDGGTFQSSGTFSGLSSGAHAVSVKDATGCIYTTSTAISDQGSPALTLVSATNVSCNGANDGSIVLSATGGSGTLQYSIDFGNTFQASGSFLNLGVGVYQALVKDATGCTSALQVIISQPSAPLITVSSNSTSCNGSDDGTITVMSHTGGTGNFQYSIDQTNWQSSVTFNGLTAGSYTVYCRDAAGCTTSAMISVDSPAAITATSSTIDNLCFNGSAGSAIINATGGTGTLMYSIGDEPQYDNGFDGLENGSYTVTVTDENMCSATVNFSIGSPAQLTATITSGQATCGNANGTLLAVAAGGTSPYQYSMDGMNFNGTGNFTALPADVYYVLIMDDNGCTLLQQTSVINSNAPSLSVQSSSNASCNGSHDGSVTVLGSGGSGTLQYSIDGDNYSTNATFSGLGAGTYDVFVQDANGCISSATVTITEPSPIALSPTITNVDCHGSATGAILVSAAGGSGTLAFSNNGGNTFQSNNTFSNQLAGTYNLVVRDAAGCSNSAMVTITEPTAINAVASILNVTCHGANNGGIYVFSNGGTGARQYSIDGINYQSSPVFSGLGGGMYDVYVKDANGCIFILTVNVPEPAALSLSYTGTNVTCSGGDNGVIDLEVSGGTMPYSYLWSNFAISQDIFNLSAGTYSVNVEDANGCTITGTYAINQPANPVIVNGTSSNASSQTATDGAINVTVSGGGAPYTYSWSNGATTEDISGLAPGVYTVIVTDANGCSASSTFTVSFSVGVQELMNSSVNVFPNPVKDYLTIDATGLNVNKVEIFNVVGQQVYSAQVNSSNAKISVNELTPGMYIIRMDVNNQVVTKRFEVVK